MPRYCCFWTKLEKTDKPQSQFIFLFYFSFLLFLLTISFPFIILCLNRLWLRYNDTPIVSCLSLCLLAIIIVIRSPHKERKKQKINEKWIKTTKSNYKSIWKGSFSYYFTFIDYLLHFVCDDVQCIAILVLVVIAFHVKCRRRFDKSNVSY